MTQLTRTQSQTTAADQIHELSTKCHHTQQLIQAFSLLAQQLAHTTATGNCVCL